MALHGPDANVCRATWLIYADFAQVLIRIARPLYARDPMGKCDLHQSLYVTGLEHQRPVPFAVPLDQVPPRTRLRRINIANPRLDRTTQHPRVYPALAIAKRTTLNILDEFLTVSPAPSTSWIGPYDD